MKPLRIARSEFFSEVDHDHVQSTNIYVFVRFTTDDAEMGLDHVEQLHAGERASDDLEDREDLVHALMPGVLGSWRPALFEEWF